MPTALIYSSVMSLTLSMVHYNVCLSFPLDDDRPEMSFYFIKQPPCHPWNKKFIIIISVFLFNTLLSNPQQSHLHSICCPSIPGKAVPFVELTVAHASVLTILAISFERYYAICEPLKAGYVCTKTRAILICFMAWIVAALFTR